MAKPKTGSTRARQATVQPPAGGTMALALAPVVDRAEFQREMLAGFDRLMKTGGLSPVEEEDVMLEGFRTRPAR